MKTSKEQLKQLAELAAEKGFSWIAQDGRDGIWYGYKIQPEYKKYTEVWVNDNDSKFESLHLPDDTDYSKQLFNVKEILNNE